MKGWSEQEFTILAWSDDDWVRYWQTRGLCRGPLAVHHTDMIYKEGRAYPKPRSSLWTISLRVRGLRLVRRIRTRQDAVRIADDIIKRWGKLLKKPADVDDVNAIYHCADSTDLSVYLKQVQDEVTVGRQ